MGFCGRGRTHVTGVLLAAILIIPSWARGGQLEDVLLENKQITVDQWVKLKAEEEKRQERELAESRQVGDVPVQEHWWEKISVRGYVQFRYNYSINNDYLQSPQGDRSINGTDEFYIRRARLIVSGQPHERVFVYSQYEFAGLVNNVDQVGVLRDLYADVFLTSNKEWRLRAGLTKVPYGFENLQSSQNRIPLDRSDALNSPVYNERDLGLFLYYSPTSVRELFRRLVDSGLKGSGDYGMLGIGVYNGQGTNTLDANKNKHVAFHSMIPFELPWPNGQIIQVGMDAYTGQFNVPTTPVSLSTSLGVSGQAVAPTVLNGGNYQDERVAWHFVAFPQPFGFQGEYTIGRGPRLNSNFTLVETSSLRGGYLQAYYNYQCQTLCQNIFPFIRVQEYFGGQKAFANTPGTSTREWAIGLEYQFNRALELTIEYTWTQRNTNNTGYTPAVCSGNSLTAPNVPCLQTPYQLQSGNLLRFQLQWVF